MAISISYSKLNTFLSCLLKYQKQYVEQLAGEKTSSSSQQLGKYIHKVLEDYREGIDIHELSKLYETKYVIAEQEKQVVGPLLETAKMFYEPYAGLPYESELKLEYYIKDPHGSMEDIRLVGVIDKIYFDPNGKIYIIAYGAVADAETLAAQEQIAAI